MSVESDHVILGEGSFVLRGLKEQHSLPRLVGGMHSPSDLSCTLHYELLNCHIKGTLMAFSE